MQNELSEEITKSFRKLVGKGNATMAVRSSATAEDLENASFAGQLESFLNIGEKQVLATVKKCFASLFTDRAIVYSFDKKLDHTKINVSVGVQKMVRGDRASSGVMFTLDTETGFRNVVLINSAWGLGNNIVKGAVTPDQYFVFKPTLKIGYSPIIGKNLGSKKIKSIYSKEGLIKNIKTIKKDQLNYSLTNNEVLKLAGWAVEIEDYYKKPMDIEWAKDGNDGKIYIVQARPETIYKEKTSRILEQYSLGERGEAILTGKAIGSKIGKGWVKILDNVREIDKFNGGEVLVTKMTDPDWVPIMKKASAIITESGGRTCHAAADEARRGDINSTESSPATLKDALLRLYRARKKVKQLSLDLEGALTKDSKFLFKDQLSMARKAETEAEKNLLKKQKDIDSQAKK